MAPAAVGVAVPSAAAVSGAAPSADDPGVAPAAVGVAVPSAAAVSVAAPSADDPGVAPAAVGVAMPLAAAVSVAAPSADDPPVAPAAESIAMPETESPAGNTETISDNATADNAGQVGNEPPLDTTAPELTIASEVCTAE